MKVLVISPVEADKGPAMLYEHSSKFRVDILHPKYVLNDTDTRPLSADLVILSESLEDPDRNLCLQWACDLFRAEGRTKGYIKSHIIFV